MNLENTLLLVVIGCVLISVIIIQSIIRKKINKNNSKTKGNYKYSIRLGIFIWLVAFIVMSTINIIKTNNSCSQSDCGGFSEVFVVTAFVIALFESLIGLFSGMILGLIIDLAKRKKAVDTQDSSI